MMPNLNLWLIPVLPLIGAALNGLFGKRLTRQAVASAALAFSGAAFGLALFVAARFSTLELPHVETVAQWIRAGNFRADFAFYLDQLSLVMLLVVTGVGFLIHIYSVGYMWEEGGFYRFFSYLNLFMFFMLTLVLANNYLVMFIGWEGVWLPDAMEGPTPVSALIHAATMVTAGVYMVARSHMIFEHAPIALTVVAIIGTLTALFAATIGIAQTDIKKVLAYSTISQLGYM